MNNYGKTANLKGFGRFGMFVRGAPFIVLTWKDFLKIYKMNKEPTLGRWVFFDVRLVLFEARRCLRFRFGSSFPSVRCG